MNIQEHVINLKTNGWTIIKNNNSIYQQKLFDEMQSYLTDSSFLSVNTSSFQTIYQPFLRCPSTINLSLSKSLHEVLQNYWQSQPYIVRANLRKSFANSENPTGTELFHRDRESMVLLKALFYLTDVTLEDGPFTYVEGSFNPDGTKNHIGYGPQKRFSDKEIINTYGEDKIKYLTANCGDIIVANTTGFHKGLKCRRNDRYLLTPTFNPSPLNEKCEFKISKNRYDMLDDYGKKVFTYLIKDETSE